MDIGSNTNPDSLSAWMARYQQMAVSGVRSQAVARKIALHLDRFLAFFRQTYGHERISTCGKRDALAWQTVLGAKDLAPSTVNNHLASLSAFTTWVHSVRRVCAHRRRRHWQAGRGPHRHVRGRIIQESRRVHGRFLS